MVHIFAYHVTSELKPRWVSLFESVWLAATTRTDIVFNGAAPRIDQAFLLAQNEADLQMLARAKGLYTLWSLLDLLVSSVWW